MPDDAAEARKRHILVVEDDAATRMLLKRQLERANYAVAACENGREALQVIGGDGAEIVVADWVMPEMTGIELCRAVQELRTAQAVQGMYFILVTAHSERSSVIEAFEAGVDDFLRKPYDVHELLARIRAGERILDLQTELLGRQIELAKTNAQLAVLNSRLKRLAETDTLTNLPNRRHVLDFLSMVWTSGGYRPLSCIMFDIDHFKRINDSFGHQAGDLVLQDVSQIARRSMPTSSICGRFGGEEFLVVCPEVTLEQTLPFAEDLRAQVAAQPIDCGGEAISVTVSVGVASRCASHGNADALIAAADRMLYQAKDAGRNQVWFADQYGRSHCHMKHPAQSACDPVVPADEA